MQVNIDGFLPYFYVTAPSAFTEADLRGDSAEHMVSKRFTRAFAELQVNLDAALSQAEAAAPSRLKGKAKAAADEAKAAAKGKAKGKGKAAAKAESKAAAKPAAATAMDEDDDVEMVAGFEGFEHDDGSDQEDGGQRRERKKAPSAGAGSTGKSSSADDAASVAARVVALEFVHRKDLVRTSLVHHYLCRAEIAALPHSALCWTVLLSRRRRPAIHQGYAVQVVYRSSLLSSARSALTSFFTALFTAPSWWRAARKCCSKTRSRSVPPLPLPPRLLLRRPLLRLQRSLKRRSASCSVRACSMSCVVQAPAPTEWHCAQCTFINAVSTVTSSVTTLNRRLFSPLLAEFACQVRDVRWPRTRPCSRCRCCCPCARARCTGETRDQARSVQHISRTSLMVFVAAAAAAPGGGKPRKRFGWQTFESNVDFYVRFMVSETGSL